MDPVTSWILGAVGAVVLLILTTVAIAPVKRALAIPAEIRADLLKVQTAIAGLDRRLDLLAERFAAEGRSTSRDRSDLLERAGKADDASVTLRSRVDELREVIAVLGAKVEQLAKDVDKLEAAR